MTLQELNQRVTRLEIQAEDAAKKRRQLIATLDIAKARAVDLLEAQTVIQDVVRQTQEQLEYQLSELTSLALESVFENPYKLRVLFENKRGRTEAVIMFEDAAGNLLDPMDASGVGPVDVAAFALRLTLLCASRPRLRPTVLLDEPFRCVSRDLQARVRDMLVQVSRRLKVQFIIITHDEDMADAADKAWKVVKVDGISTVSTVGKASESAIDAAEASSPLSVPPPETKPPVKRRKRT